MWESTASNFSLVLLGEGGGGGGTISVEGVDRVKGLGGARAPHPQQAGPKITMTECTQESGHLQSMYSIVCGFNFCKSPGTASYPSPWSYEYI
jgi:hypothetical protein